MERRTFLGTGAAVTAGLLTGSPRGLAASFGEDGNEHRRAMGILKQTPLIDGHNDVAWQYRQRTGNRLDGIDLRRDTSRLDPPMHTDIPRLRQGRVGGQFWSVYVSTELSGPQAAKAQLEQLDMARRMILRYQEFAFATTAEQIEQASEYGRIASMLGMEGGHVLDNSLAVLRMCYEAGARYLTLTHDKTHDWADSATDEPRHDGLSEFGRVVVSEMNWLGMLVDLSHVHPRTMHDALDASEAPVVFSHSSARAVRDHPRNVPDDVLDRVADNGGVVMVTFVPSYISDKPTATVADVADHIDHIRARVGVEHIGIGADYDGITQTPQGLEDVSTYPNLFAELLRRGYADTELRNIAGSNLLRVMRGAEDVSARLRKRREASDAKFEDFTTAGKTPAGQPASSSRTSADTGTR